MGFFWCAQLAGQKINQGSHAAIEPALVASASFRPCRMYRSHGVGSTVVPSHPHGGDCVAGCTPGFDVKGMARRQHAIVDGGDHFQLRGHLGGAGIKLCLVGELRQPYGRKVRFSTDHKTFLYGDGRAPQLREWSSVWQHAFCVCGV